MMLYDGAVRFLEQAQLGFREEDPLAFNQTINNNVIRAQAIINELNYSLDMEAGEQFAQTLRRLYDYMDRTLQVSNQRKSLEGIVDVTNRIKVLRDAWGEMIRKSPDASDCQAPTLAAA
jgi:flagellar protein FliS